MSKLQANRREGVLSWLAGESATETEIGWASDLHPADASGFPGDDLDRMLEWFIEGNDDPATIAPEKTGRMMAAVQEEAPSCLWAYAGGPIYWAYRKCYRGATMVFALFVAMGALGLYFGSTLPALPAIAVSGSAFYWAYRHRFLRMARAAYAQGYRRASDQGLEPYLRSKGGTSLGAAGAACVAWLAAAVLVVFVETSLFPWL